MLRSSLLGSRRAARAIAGGRSQKLNHQKAQTNISKTSTRLFASSTDERLNAPRDSDQADVVIVGGGPSGLATAIRIKQMCQASGKDLRVCLLEKSAEVGMLW